MNNLLVVGDGPVAESLAPLASLLGWSREERDRQLADYQRLVALHRPRAANPALGQDPPA
ncbi:MAG: hypothetical protein AAGC63_15945 [Propionicimonas sp.]